MFASGSLLFAFAPLRRSRRNPRPTRGRTGAGLKRTATGEPPVAWSDTSNVKWKVEIPGRGYSTPVAWGDRLLLTTAIPTGKKSRPPRPRRYGADAVPEAAVEW